MGGAVVGAVATMITGGDWFMVNVSTMPNITEKLMPTARILPAAARWGRLRRRAVGEPAARRGVTVAGGRIAVGGGDAVSGVTVAVGGIAVGHGGSLVSDGAGAAAC